MRGYLLQPTEQELIERERRAAERRPKAARFPTVKTLESSDFTTQPSINKTLVVQLMRCVYAIVPDVEWALSFLPIAIYGVMGSP